MREQNFVFSNCEQIYDFNLRMMVLKASWYYARNTEFDSCHLYGQLWRCKTPFQLTNTKA